MDNSVGLVAVPERHAEAQMVLQILFNPQRGTFVAEVGGLRVSREESRAIATEVLQTFQAILEVIYSTRPLGMEDRLV